MDTEEDKENEDKTQSEGMVIEARPITDKEVSPGERQEIEKEVIIREVLSNVVGDFYDWLGSKPNSTIRKYKNADTLDVVIDYLSEYGDAIYRRIMRMNTVFNKLNRITGSGNRGGFSQRDIERMIWERLAGSITGSFEENAEVQRRRRVSDEIINELMRENEQKGNKSSGDEKNSD